MEMARLTGPDVVQLNTGKWKAYFSGLPKAGTGPDPGKCIELLRMMG